MNAQHTAALVPATQGGNAQSPNEVIRMSMDTVAGFEALQRAANLLSAATLVPEVYRRWTVDKDGNRTDNPSGLANCVVALNMAARMGADPLMICQNMHVIEGRPSWSSPFVIAQINQCGKFSPLRFEISPEGPETEVEYTYTEWSTDEKTGKRRPTDKTGKLKVKHRTCRAWAIELATGERIDGPEVSIQMAIDEGWMQKKGSKWKTMPELMLRYRSAAFFGRLYCPELLMGLQSREEMEDVFDVIDSDTGEIQTVRTKVRDVTPRSAPAGMPSGVGKWTVQQMDELEELIERASDVMRKAGYVKEAEAFEASTRAKRAGTDPEKLLSELRASVDELTAQKTAGIENQDGSLFPGGEK